MSNPFGPYGKPQEELPTRKKDGCPKCESENIDARQNEFANFWVCRGCGNTWSGSTVGAHKIDLSQAPSVQGQAAREEEDEPVKDFGGYRNPAKTFDYNDE